MIQWLQLNKTNGEVYVRVSDKVELEGLPEECNLMAVSNMYGLVAVGGQSGSSRVRVSSSLIDDRRADTQAGGGTSTTGGVFEGRLTCFLACRSTTATCAAGLGQVSLLA
jgi:hypothetical protein